MWLRDSTNQFLPYIRIPEECPHITALARGLINTQAEFIMIDPYTNAFKKFEKPNVQRHFYLNDKTTVLVMGIPVDLTRNREYATKSIWERKFEIDAQIAADVQASAGVPRAARPTPTPAWRFRW